MESLRPNILFITTDQQNVNTLGCYGNNRIDTPNIDSLAQEGAKLERAYVTCPLCTPSRGSMLSGRYPHVTGIIVNDDGRKICYPDEIKGLSDVLYESGYNCAYFGKWHLGRENTPQHGFYAGWETFIRGSYEDWLEETGKFKFPPDLKLHKRSVVPFELAHDTHVANRTIDFIKNYNSEEPFALWCAFRSPHDPYIGPFTDKYSPEDVDLPASIDDTLDNKPFNQKLSWSIKYKEEVEKIKEKNDFKSTIARYWGSTHAIDINVGRVMEELDRKGIKDNTIVIFHSDHGDMMGAHGLIAKGPYMYEETNRVPFIIRYPSVIRPETSMKGLFSLVDIAPTILDLAEIKYTEKFDGISAANAIVEGKDYFRQAVFSEIFEIVDQRCVLFNVRTQKWKYSYYFGDMDELYDMENDPFEMNNLAEKEDCVDVVNNCRNLIAEWLNETGDISAASILSIGKERPMNWLSRQVGNMKSKQI